VRVGGLRGGGRQARITASRSPSGAPVNSTGRGVVWFVAWRLQSVVYAMYYPLQEIRTHSLVIIDERSSITEKYSLYSSVN
jgi:hypothetical protein